MPEASGGFAVVLTTAASDEQARSLAEAVVDRKLAACVNVVPGATSFYRWKGEIRRDTEWLLVIKTTRARFGALREAILALHTYETPEVVMLPVEDGSPAYLRWIADSVA